MTQSWRRSWWRALAALGAATLSVGAVPAAAPHRSPGPTTTSSTPPPLPSATTRSLLTVIAQSPWVSGGTSAHFSIELRVSSRTPPDANLALYVYPRLTTRTDFDTTLTGRMRSYPIWQSGPLAVSKLPTGPAGGADVVLPVDSAVSSPPGVLPSIALDPSNNGVYPLQIGVVDPSNGAFLGTPVTTYLIWVPNGSGFPKLAVSWVLAVHAPPALTATGAPARLAAGEVAVLAGETAAIDAHPTVPLSLKLDPQTLVSLSSAGPSARATLSTLSSVVAGHDQILPAPYVPLDIPAMETAGLDGEVTSQLRAGARALQTALRVSADPSTWAVNGALDASAAGTLEGRGARRFVVPEGDLSPPPRGQQTTFAQPTALESSSGRISVLGADTKLGRHFTNTGDQVLQADQLLAELAMIETETPSVPRGVGILTPRGWIPNTAFLNTVLNGLEANPLLQPMTLDQLFASVPRAGSQQDPFRRSLVSPRPGPGSLPQASAIRSVRRRLAAFGSTFPTLAPQVSAFAQRVLVGESSDLSGRKRSAVLGGVAGELTKDMSRVRLPPGVSLTLTAQNGNVPVTVLSSTSGPVHVRLQLSSQKLTFHSFTPAGGSCQSSNATTVVCRLTLTGPATTLRVPVVARTTGVFSLQIALRSGDGSLVLGEAHYTVRSTAVSLVAIILMIGALLFLGVWWVRDRRHGRRARQLVDPPMPSTDDADAGGGNRSGRAADAMEAGPAPGGTGRASEQSQAMSGRHAPGASSVGNPLDAADMWIDHDPVVAEFFASPPPDYPDQPPRAGRPR